MLNTTLSRIFRSKRIYQYVAAITANLGIFCSELHYGWSSPTIPILTSGNYTFTITSEEASWLVVIPLLGAIVGGLLGAALLDIIGRRKLIYSTALPFIASWLLIAFAKSSIPMFIGRFISGVLDGLSFTAVPIYVAEISDPGLRGLLGSVVSVVAVLAILVANILGFYLPLVTSAFVSTSIPILFLLTFPWMPESPYFYLMKNDTNAARDSLKAFKGVDDVEEELQRMATAVREDMENKGRVQDLVTVKSNRQALVLAVGLRAIQQLSGIYATIFYCKTVFEESKDFLSAEVATIIYFALQLALSFVASFTVDSFGRRPLLLVSTAGTATALFLNGTYLYVKQRTDIDMGDISWFPVFILMAYMVFYSIGLEIVPLVVASEIFPVNVRSYALCATDISYSVVVTCVSQFFHWTNESYGMFVPFYGFTVCCLFGIVFIAVLVPETKGKTLEDIQDQFRKSQ
uniref:Trehalose transporter 1a n=1 Tax=Colaphellus bowringi TaxID=561076 RepID=A0A7D5AY29_9CUCU|nr:trehalose transporter 1a [Colaphellus bowringi]